MPCYRPLQAWKGRVLESGKRAIVFKRGEASPALVCFDLKLPCGSCVGCRLERSRQWAMRCMDEASLFSRNSFVTLTFDDEHMPANRSLDVSVFQRFMKRLRKYAKGTKVRYFHCGEYGSVNGRPHYHALLFNWDFDDRVLFKQTGSGSSIYTSQSLCRLWPFGYSSVGDVTFGSAAYVARYHLKKVGGVVAKDHYCNPRTGECLAPEYVTMSRRDGIGKGWYDKFKFDMFPSDVRIIDGVKTIPARYYGNLYEIENPEDYARIKSNRVSRATVLVDGHDDNDVFRLSVKEEVKLAQLRSLHSNLEDK